jgi:hypothetical protein
MAVAADDNADIADIYYCVIAGLIDIDIDI